MPSYRVSRAPLSLDMFDVVGKDGDEAGFIGHVGLAFAGDSQDVIKTPVFDMGPPLRGAGEPGHITASVVGTIALMDDEVRKIQTFIDRHTNEHRVFRHIDPRQLATAAPTMYRIHPHSEPFREDDGRYARTRFSCAGFVFEAYRKARIRLVDFSAMPMVDVAVINSGYRRHLRFMEAEGVTREGSSVSGCKSVVKRRRVDGSGCLSIRVHPRVRQFCTQKRKSPREALGLAGDGPWPILLCGYLFHSLNRDANAVRHKLYAPDIADRYFT